jgi:hypothetical protein
MLGFGVVVGSLVGGSEASPIAQVVVEVHHLPASTESSGSEGANAAGGGSTGGGSVTITTTTPAPQSSTPAVAGGKPASTPTPVNTHLPPIKHVFMVVLSDQGYNQTFAASRNDPYLAKRLVKQGELLVNYYAVAGSPLANEIAMVSGQGPNPETAADCPTYDPFISSGFGVQGQQLGSGCVYPATVPSLPGQLTADKLTWKAYLQTKAGQPKAGAEQCQGRIGNSRGFRPTLSQPYTRWRNPFLYFRGLTATACPKPDAPLGQLAHDLKRASTTPTLSYIVADACHDGSDIPCAPNAKDGMGPADGFLESVIPEIERSPAYRQGAMIAITFDEAPQSGPNADSSSCCNNPRYPNMLGSGSSGTGTTTTGTTTGAGTSGTTPTGTTPTGTGATTTSGTTSTSTTPTTTTSATSTTPASLGGGETNPTGGGGHVGLLLISKYIRPNTLEATNYYNHFSLLASIEQLFGLQRLGYAADKALPVFDTAVWTNYSAG